MVQVSGKIIQELLLILTPFMRDKQQRQTYLELALGTNSLVLGDFEWEGSANVFINQMVNKLVAFGEITPGKPALCALLEVYSTWNVGFREDFLKSRVEYPAQKAKEWLEGLLKHCLVESKASEFQQVLIQFHHQLFQEYYAAEYLLRLLPNLSDRKLKRDYLNYLKWTESIVLALALVEDEGLAVRVVRLALDVDLMLGGRLAGEVKEKFQEKTVGLVFGLEVPELIKVEFLDTTKSQSTIDYLSNCLQHKDFNVRVIAACALGKIGNEKAVNTIITDLQHQDFNVRRLAASALVKIGDKAAVNSLIAALQHQDFNVRMIAIDALEKIGNEAAVNTLIAALQDKNSSVRKAAALALGVTCNATAISPLTTSLQDEDSSVSSAAEFALGEIRDKTVINPLITDLQHKDLSVRLTAIDKLRKIGNKSAVDTLMAALQDENLPVRKAAALALAKIGNKDSLNTIITAKQYEDLSVYSTPKFILREIGGNETPVNILIPALQDEDSSVRRAAALELGLIRNQAAVNSLIAAFLKDKDLFVRRVTVFALGEIGDEVAVNPLIDSLHYEDFYVSESAASVLGRIADSDKLAKIWYLLKSGIYNTKDIILKIQERCNFYNHEIFHSPSMEAINSQESEKKYNIHADTVQIIEKNHGNVMGKKTTEI